MALTKVGSVGIATGISLTGVTTTQDAKVGTGITLSPDGDGYYTGIVTATSYRGDVSNCTGVGQTNFIDAESINVSGITSVGAGITLSPDGDVYATGVSTFKGAASIDGALSVGGDLTIPDNIVHTGDTDTSVRFTGANTIALQTGGTQRLVADSSGFVGIGSVSPVDTAGAGHCLDIQGASATAIYLRNTNRDTGQIDFAASTMTIRTRQATPILFNVNNSERARIDTSGRLLIATTDTDSVSDGEVPKLIIKGTDSTAGAAFVRHSADTGGTGIYLGKSRNATVGSNTIVQDDDELGRITFSGDDGTNINTMGSKIASYVDGTPGANDMPGRLVFYTTADGAASPTERLRINSSGQVVIGTNPTVHADYILHVEKASGETNIKVEGSTSTLGARISLQNNDTTANAYNQYAFNDAGGQSTSAINGINTDQTNNYGELAFLTRNAQGTPPQERVRITKDGNVGINDASPANQLIVKAAGGSGHSCAKVVSGDGNQLLTMQVIQGAEARLGTDSGAPLALYSNGNEYARLQTTGQLTLGTTTDVAPDGFGSKIQVNASNHEGSIQVGRHTANANGPALLFLKTRSGSATPGTGVVSDDDNLGTIRFFGSDGTDTASSAAQIQCHVDASAGTNDMPGRLTFGTTPDGQSSPKESMRIDSYGSLMQSGGHCSGAQMDNYTPGSASMPKFFQSDGNTNTKSGDAWTTVLNVGTSHPTWDLFSIKGSTNFGIWVEVTCYFSQITSGTYGRQRVAYRVQRNGNADFGTSVTDPYDKVVNNNDKFIPTISTSGSGSSMRATFRIQGTGLTNYCQTMYHIRWVCGDNGAEPIMYY